MQKKNYALSAIIVGKVKNTIVALHAICNVTIIYIL